MPYKTYRAKVTGTATLKYIPFSEGETNRLYRGEGTIQFTCYEPYAICRKKWLDEYDNTNKGEWKEASRLLSSGDGYDQVHGADTIKLYNAGDIESHFTLRIDFYEGKIPASSMTIESMDSSVSKVFKWSELTSQGKDTGVIFNSKINLIEGCDSNGKKTGTVYNKFITEGDFFKIPLGESTLTFDKANGEPSVHSIEYFYYYI
jgi:phage-related protein